MVALPRGVEWLKQLSGLRQNDSDDLVSTADTPLSSDDRRRLIEGVHFTKGFIVTYQYALLSILLLFTIHEWYGQLARARRRRQRLVLYGDDKSNERERSTGNNTKHVTISEQESITSSSSSSTSGGILRPAYNVKPTGHSGEHQPLVSSSRRLERQSVVSGLSRVLARVQSLLMYQLPDVPVMQRVMPSNATTFLVLCLLALNLFYALWRTGFPHPPLFFVFADRVGLLFVANLPWLYLLAAKNQPIKLLTGYSYENLNIIHRRLGEWLCLLAVGHLLGMVATWYCFLSPRVGLWEFLTLRLVLLGIGAFVCYEVLYFTSLSSFRQWWYEAFLATHVLLQAGALSLVWFHYHTSRVYVGIALCIFLIDRLVFRLALKTRTINANLTVMEDGNTVMVSANWPVLSRRYNIWTMLFGIDARFGWKPTEHVFLTIPALARKHWIQAHPFSIASAAPEDSEHAWFNLVVRVHDGFTHDLLKYAQTHSSVNVRLDGSYGSMHACDMLRDSSVSIIVAGGSGIAVAYPLVWTLLHRFRNDPETLPRSRKVALIWVVHEASHVSWIGHERLNELRDLGLHVILPAPTAKVGRPDVEMLVRDAIDGFTSNEITRERIGVVCSGPDGMNRTVRNTCAALAWNGLNIDVAVEKFGW